MFFQESKVESELCELKPEAWPILSQEVINYPNPILAYGGIKLFSCKIAQAPAPHPSKLKKYINKTNNWVESL